MLRFNITVNNMSSTSRAPVHEHGLNTKWGNIVKCVYKVCSFKLKLKNSQKKIILQFLAQLSSQSAYIGLVYSVRPFIFLKLANLDHI